MDKQAKRELARQLYDDIDWSAAATDVLDVLYDVAYLRGLDFYEAETFAMDETLNLR